MPWPKLSEDSEASAIASAMKAAPLRSPATEFEQHAQELVSNLGLYPVERPEHALAWPRDLANLPDEGIAQHLTYWSAITGYVEYRVSILRGALIRKKDAYTEEYALRCSQRHDSSFAKTKRIVESRSSVRALATYVARLEADVEILDAVRRGYERNYHAVSRELTRRGQDKARKI